MDFDEIFKKLIAYVVDCIEKTENIEMLKKYQTILNHLNELLSSSKEFRNKKWTIQERKTVVQMRNNKMSIKKIAEMFETGESNIKRILFEEKCVVQPRVFSAEQWEEAKQMRKDGSSYGDIAKKFNLKYTQVSNKFYKEGMKGNGFSEVV